MEPKLCINCKHYWENNFGACRRPSNKKSLVHGGDILFGNSAEWERRYGWLDARMTNTCGKEGRFFELKLKGK